MKIYLAIVTIQWLLVSPALSFESFEDFSKNDRKSKTDDGKVIVQGGGGSFPNDLYQDALFAYSRAQHTSVVTYTSLSSSRGKCRIMNYLEKCLNPFRGTGSDQSNPAYLDFSSSESILKPEDYTAYPDLQLYPAIAGAISPVYNIPGYKKLVLSTGLLSRMFRQCDDEVAGCLPGSIKYWNHTDIVALNPDAEAYLQAAGQIVLHVRAATSGTTEAFKKALSTFDTDFFTQVGTSSSADWGVVQVQKVNGITGIAAAIASTPGAIGYVSTGDADLFGLMTAQLGESPSTAVSPSSVTVQNAITEVGLQFGNNGDDPKHLTSELFSAKGQQSWPISTYSYFVMRKETLRRGSTCANREATVKFLMWFYTDPIVTTLAAKYGMAALPPSVANVVTEQLVNDIKCSKNQMAYEPLNLPPIRILVDMSIERAISLAVETFSVVSERVEMQTGISAGMSGIEETTYLSTSNGDGGIGVSSASAIAFVEQNYMLEAWDSIAHQVHINIMHAVPYASVPMSALVNLCGASADCPYSSLTLNLSPQVLAAILQGEITKWNHVDIANENVDVALPDADIIVGHLATSAGESWLSQSIKFIRKYREDFTFNGVSIRYSSMKDFLKAMLGTPNIIVMAPTSILKYSSITRTNILISVPGKGLVPVPPTSANALTCAKYQLQQYELNGKSTVDWNKMPRASDTPTDFDVDVPCYPFTSTVFLLFSSSFSGQCDEFELSSSTEHAEFIAWVMNSEALSPALRADSVAFIPSLMSNEDREVASTSVWCNKESIVKPREDYSLISPLIEQSVGGITWFLIVLCIILFIWTIVFRKHQIIRLASPIFLTQLLLGSCLMLATNFLLLQQESEGYPQLTPPEKTSVVNRLHSACIAIPFVWSIGFCLSYTPLILKSWRVVQLFRNAKLKKVSIPNQLLIKYELCISAVFLIIIVSWTLFDPLRWDRAAIVVDNKGNILRSAGSCQCDSPWVWIGMLLAIIISYLVFGNYLARKGSDVPVAFNEGKWIGFALSNMLQILLFSIPVIVIAQSDASTLVVVRTLANILCVTCTLAFVFIPKLFSWVTEELLSYTQKLSSQRKTSHNHSSTSGIGTDPIATGQVVSHQPKTPVASHHSKNAVRHSIVPAS